MKSERLSILLEDKSQLMIINQKKSSIKSLIDSIR
ncbi:hypothetical protein QF044_003070 [Chryseobacterium sp. W4I1]|nr:hypothetical protein [Chryseobacterium sp. W4I1]